MSIYGSLGGMLGGLVEQSGGPQAIAGQVLDQMGGVQGGRDKLRQAGLGSHVLSWLGNDPKQPVSAGEITDALGHGQLGEIASHCGVPQHRRAIRPPGRWRQDSLNPVPSNWSEAGPAAERRVMKAVPAGMGDAALDRRTALIR